MCLSEKQKWTLRRIGWMATWTINLYTLITSIIWLTLLFQEELRTHNTIISFILFTLVILGEFGDRILVIHLAHTHVHNLSSPERTPLLFRRRYDPAPPPTWTTFASMLTVLGGPPGAYLWFEVGDRWGPRRGFVRRYRVVITSFTVLFRALFIVAMGVSLTIPLDSSDCSIFLPIKCKEDALRIIFAFIAIIISSFTALGDLIALTLTLFGIKLGLQKGEADDDETDPRPSAPPISTSASESDDDVPDALPRSPPGDVMETRREWKVFRRAYSSSTEWVVPVGVEGGDGGLDVSSGVVEEPEEEGDEVAVAAQV
ncbi:hypothetical protein BC829DRAFT_125031 [Chytridium lagenaria]|nr:hypothetical protein BC829DRAFT_125031 [Chytridium lagenaria]